MKPVYRRLLLLLLAGLPAAIAWLVFGYEFPEEEKTVRSEFRGFLLGQFPGLAGSANMQFGIRLVKDGRKVPIERELPAKAVVLVHGLDEPGKLWMNLIPVLEEEGYTVCPLRYPNDQPISESSAFFIDQLGILSAHGVREMVIVAHSMGGLVSREMLTSPVLDYKRWEKLAAVPRVRALITVGAPNQGSELARLRGFAEIRDQWMQFLKGEGHLLNALADGAGEAGIDLLPGSRFLTGLNARPLPEGVAVTIIAGVASPLREEEVEAMLSDWDEMLPDSSDAALDALAATLNSLSDGVGDGAVPLQSTYITGVEDHVIVPGNHLSMIRNVLAGSSREPPAIPVILDRLDAVWGRMELGR